MRGCKSSFPNKIVFLSLYMVFVLVVFVLANSVDLDEMLHDVAGFVQA